jgi:hypothetical protein
MVVLQIVQISKRNKNSMYITFKTLQENIKGGV